MIDLNKSFTKIEIGRDAVRFFAFDVILKNKYQVIAILGPSGSGKTTLAQNLLNLLTSKKAVLISVDDYWKYKREEMTKRNLTGYDWESRDKDKFLADLKLLKKGKNIDKPIFNYAEEIPTGKTELIVSKDVIILEATLDFKDIADITIFTYADDCILIKRRIERDKNKKTFENGKKLKKYVVNTSIPSYKKNLLPLSHEAHFIFDSGNNTVYKNNKFA